MKIKELIEILEMYDQDATIRVLDTSRGDFKVLKAKTGEILIVSGEALDYTRELAAQIAARSATRKEQQSGKE